MIEAKIEKNLFDQVVVMTAGIGLFLSTLDTGIINVALPILVQSFHSSVSMVTWTVTLYTLALVGTIITFGRLGDKFGRLKIYSWGLIVFFVASALCGISTSLGELIGFRAVQGIGAAMLQATAMGIVTTTIPKKRQGVAFGTMGVLLGLGPVLGPSIGGLLISLGSWRWIFWINIPIAVLGLVGCSFLVKKVKESRSTIKLDLPGNVLLSFSILTLLEGLSISSTSGILSLATIGLVIFFVILFVSFIIWELRAEQPIMDFGLFRSGAFTAPVFAYLCLVGQPH